MFFQAKCSFVRWVIRRKDEYFDYACSFVLAKCSFIIRFIRRREEYMKLQNYDYGDMYAFLFPRIPPRASCIPLSSHSSLLALHAFLSPLIPLSWRFTGYKIS